MRRREALAGLWRDAENGDDDLPRPGDEVNLHAHTFFSYNAYGYSPSKFAWLARKAGLAVAGHRRLRRPRRRRGIPRRRAGSSGSRPASASNRGCSSPNSPPRVINSPGEPGIAYHMGVGFPAVPQHPFLAEMRAAAEQRTRELLLRVNAFLDAASSSITKGRDATDAQRQRHRAPPLRGLRTQSATRCFLSADRRAAFWKGRLGDAPTPSAKLQGAHPRQDDEEGRRRVCAARQRVVPADGRHEPFRPRSGGDSDADLARRHERRRTGHRGVFRGRQVLAARRR